MTGTNTTTSPKKAQPGKARAPEITVPMAVAAQPAPKASKSDALIALLSRPEGATIEAMMQTSGWQAHSVRGFLAGTLKKKLGKAVTAEKPGDGARIYRLAGEATA